MGDKVTVQPIRGANEMRKAPMRFAFLLDEYPPSYMMPTHLTVKCSWCCQRKFAINNRLLASLGNTICKPCADKLLAATRLYEA